MIYSKKYASKPFLLQWLVTGRCNLRCKHCYFEKRPQDAKKGRQVIDKFIDFTSAAGVSPILTFSGGEPLMHPEIHDLAKYAKQKGVRVFLLTNGLLMTEECFDRFEGCLDGVQVSLESPYKEVHEEIRGKGTFEPTVKAIKMLAEKPVILGVGMVVHKKNIKDVPAMAKFCDEVGADEAGFKRLVPEGPGKQLSEYCLSPLEIRDFYLLLERLDKEYKVSVGSNDPLGCQLHPPKGLGGPGDIKGGCIIGYGGVSMLPNGDILPCSRLEIPIGNIYKQDLAEVFTESPLLNSLRDRDSLKGKCGACELRYICGGCRAVAYAVYGDYQAEDPGCWKK